MAATVKHKRSQARQGNTRSHHRAKKPSLVKLASGKRVPAHMVTPENPNYKGLKFLSAKKRK